MASGSLDDDVPQRPLSFCRLLFELEQAHTREVEHAWAVAGPPSGGDALAEVRDDDLRIMSLECAISHLSHALAVIARNVFFLKSRDCDVLRSASVQLVKHAQDAGKEGETCAAARMPVPCCSAGSDLHTSKPVLDASVVVEPLVVTNDDRQRVCEPFSAELSVEAVLCSADAMEDLTEWDAGLSEWQARMMDCFDQMDHDRSGSIDKVELRSAFEAAGHAPAQAMLMIQRADKNNDSSIDRAEWLNVVTSADMDQKQINACMDALSKRMAKNGRIYIVPPPGKVPFLVVPFDSHFRLSWDLCLVFLLLYLVAMVPLGLAFGDAVSSRMDDVVDYFFMADIFLNFRTSFMGDEGKAITDGAHIAKHYLKTWFLLDFFSSFPFDQLSGSMMPDLQPARLLKIGKITKVFKMLKFAKIKHLLAGEQFEAVQEEIFIHQWAFKVTFMAGGTAILAHLMSCCLVISGNGFLGEYLGANPSIGSQYLAALYWAFTTMSTVGFGDIIPTSDGERAYSVIAMAIGVTFFGYVLGNITAVITAGNLNSRAYQERMELLQSWLDFHAEIPKPLRRRIRRYFKEQLTCKAALEDSVIMNDLPTELRSDLSFFLMNDEVRYNPLFHDLPDGALQQLVLAIESTSAEVGEHIVSKDQPGLAMYIIIEGVGKYTAGLHWASKGTSKFNSELNTGDSFGEEIVLGLEERYQYTVVAQTHLKMVRIGEASFADRFKSTPDVVKLMKANFMRGAAPDRVKPCCDGSTGRASIVNSAQSLPMPPSFPDAVLNQLNALMLLLEPKVSTLKPGVTKT